MQCAVESITVREDCGAWSLEMRINRCRTALSILMTATLGAFAAGAAGQAPIPRPVVVSLMSFPITVAAGNYALVNQVLDVPAGSGVPQHYHGGPVVVTVVTGELTLVDAGGERIVRAGESWTEKAGDKHAILNKTAETIRVVSSALFPKGVPRTTVVE
ncbi:MAG: cupin domain-containing protein [Candidatus Rokuibacteriota bacterium]